MSWVWFPVVHVAYNMHHLATIHAHQRPTMCDNCISMNFSNVSDKPKTSAIINIRLQLHYKLNVLG